MEQPEIILFCIFCSIYGRKFIDLQDHDYLIMQCLCGDLLKDIIQLAGLFGVITADRLYSVIKKKQLFPVLDHFPFHIPASAMPVSVYCKAQWVQKWWSASIYLWAFLGKHEAGKDGV